MSSVARTGSSVTLSSFPWNPLTTTFVPPSQCTGWYEIRTTFGTGMVVYGEGSACLPPGFDEASTSYFSPGLACPSGYQSACHNNLGVASITTVTCCPTSGDIVLSCVNPKTYLPFADLYCGWAPTSTSKYTTTVAVTQTISGITSTTTITPPFWWNVHAFGVRMVYENSDLMAASTSTSTQNSSSTLASGTQESARPSPTGKPTSGQGANTLSLAAKIAIGIVVPFVVIGAIVLGLFLWRKRKRSQASDQESKSPDAHMADSTAMYEVDGSKAYHHELESRRHKGHELDGQGLAVELPADATSSH